MLTLGLRIAALAWLLDRASKYWLISIFAMPDRQWVEITSFFNLVMWWNKGVSFSLLTHDSDTARWILVVVTGAITLALVAWLRHVRTAWSGVALGLVIGGSLGNIYDRVMFGAVADFLQFHLAEYYWPAFNIADSCISVGVGMLVWDQIRAGDKQTPAAKREDANEA